MSSEAGTDGLSRAQIIGSVVIGVLTAIAFATFAVSRPEPRPEPVQVERGSSCVALAEAQRHLEEGNDSELLVDLRNAQRAAEIALDTSGIEFGLPEEIALTMGANDLELPLSAELKAFVAERLAAALEACGEAAS